MKALVYTANEEVSYQEQAEPQPVEGDVVIKVDAVGICGSDMHAYLGHDPRRVPPMVLGHEAAGTVCEGPLVGQQFVVNPLITCQRCAPCLSGRQNLCASRELIGMNRPGTFAERVAVPARNLIPMPAGMNPVHAALTEPGATSLHALALASRALSRPLNEARTLVIGGGSVGLLAALIAVDHGSRYVELAETNSLRRESAAEIGGIQTRDPVATPPAEADYDLVIDAVGSGVTRNLAIHTVRPGGVVVHIGLQDNGGEMDVRKMTLSEITFIGTYTYTPVDLQQTMEKLHTGALGELHWAEERPLAEGDRAFDDLLRGRSSAAKIVLRP